MWINLVNLTWTPGELLHVPHPRHHVSVILSNAENSPAKWKSFFFKKQFMKRNLHKTLNWFPGGCCWFYNQWWLRRGIQGAWRLANTPAKQLLSTHVLSTILVSNFTVVVLVGGAAEHPAASPELQDLQQQQTGHGGEALLEQESIPQQEEQLIHPLVVHLLQLLSDAMQLQHQAVHLQMEVEERSVNYRVVKNPSWNINS